jgi:predicted metal-binding protein
MECHKCKAAIPEGKEQKYNNEIFCEDCYIDRLFSAKPICNPWGEYLSTRSASENDKNVLDFKDRKNFELLLQTAHSLGATDAACIPPDKIEISDELAALCKNPKCKNYGASLSCPPNVSGPGGFRQRIQNYSEAVVFKIIVPSEIMLSHQRIEIFRLLHEIGSSIENKAKQLGYAKSRAYAAGSCKKLFCGEHLKCNVLSGEGECRNPDIARQSMSGFGINVKKLMELVGWESEKPEMKSACGMVLIG